MTQYPTITRDPILDEPAERSCLPGLALFVWMVLSWIGVEHLDSLEPWAAATLLFATLLWLAWAWGLPWLVLGIVALSVALVAGDDGRSVALIWYQVFAMLTVAFGMAIVYGPSPEHLMPAVIMVVLGLILFPLFSKVREKARASAAISEFGRLQTTRALRELDGRSFFEHGGLVTLEPDVSAVGSNSFALRVLVVTEPDAPPAMLVSRMADRGYRMEIDVAGRPVFALAAGEQVVEVAGSATINDGRPHLVLGVADRRAKLLRLYVDDAEAVTAPGLGAVDLDGRAALQRVGAEHRVGLRYVSASVGTIVEP